MAWHPLNGPTAAAAAAASWRVWSYRGAHTERVSRRGSPEKITNVTQSHCVWFLKSLLFNRKQRCLSQPHLWRASCGSALPVMLRSARLLSEHPLCFARGLCALERLSRTTGGPNNHCKYDVRADTEPGCSCRFFPTISRRNVSVFPHLATKGQRV